MGEKFELQPPIILGCEIAGTIEEIGGNVEKFKPGDAVYSYIGSQSGGYAEYAVTKVDEMAPKQECLPTLRTRGDCRRCADFAAGHF